MYSLSSNRVRTQHADIVYTIYDPLEIIHWGREKVSDIYNRIFVSMAKC